MIQIPVSGGLFALVDEEYSNLKDFRWHREIRQRTDGEIIIYASRKTSLISGSRRKIYMHREIMGFPSGDVDHKDRNGLNNVLSNLRLATRSQNSAAQKQKPGSSIYRGVTKWKDRWRSQISKRGLGTYKTQEEAAEAYNIAALARYGEFAQLNKTKETLKANGG